MRKASASDIVGAAFLAFILISIIVGATSHEPDPVTPSGVTVPVTSSDTPTPEPAVDPTPEPAATTTAPEPADDTSPGDSSGNTYNVYPDSPGDGYCSTCHWALRHAIPHFHHHRW